MENLHVVDGVMTSPPPDYIRPKLCARKREDVSGKQSLGVEAYVFAEGAMREHTENASVIRVILKWILEGDAEAFGVALVKHTFF